jgi:hypothetical protein
MVFGEKMSNYEKIPNDFDISVSRVHRASSQYQQLYFDHAKYALILQRFTYFDLIERSRSQVNSASHSQWLLKSIEINLYR